ncbi:MAG TPA: helix-turn-helix transcriptional regulator [Amycolatopsis sp.]|uniref:helix-turn-helix domain-containing protein n=1 Tax=Amycolatopsis sp. TaxID=37632 RepID=UPI002B48D348|nr:helix-turn-helix transcriptional regulator [Amycolatopsis sp.]HKS45531.1 helix-turn-helix transcriptional regulator [Amycolatopsis sp.]
MSTPIGRTLRQIRNARGKSLKVIADRAGISKSYLSRLESGERALDRRSLIVALANALEVAPSEITGAGLGAPGEAGDDQAVSEVRLAMLGVAMDEPRGEVQPVEQLRGRVAAVVAAQNDAYAEQVGAELPALIRDLHTTLDAHRDEGEVLRLLALAHMQCTQAWLTMVGAPIDLAWQAATMARAAAERVEEPVSLGISAYGTSLGLLAAGVFDLASRTLQAVELPHATTEDFQLTGSLALASSLVSSARKDPAERSAALEYAAELAERTGETNMMGFGFGPSNVGVWRMQGALEAGEHAEAARIAETVNPAALTVRARQAVYWRDRGRALARLPKQRDTAVMMLRRAELISPEHVHRHPFTLSLLGELVAKVKRDAVGRELRGLAYRAGLPV